MRAPRRSSASAAVTAALSVTAVGALVLALPLLGQSVAIAAPSSPAAFATGVFPPPFPRTPPTRPPVSATTPPPRPTTPPVAPTTVAPAPTTQPAVVLPPPPTTAAIIPTTAALPVGPTPAELAKLQREAAAAAAAAAAKAQRDAARLAAQTAAADQRGSVAWQHRGRPNKLVIIHQTSVDSIQDGQIVRHLVRNASTTTLQSLDAAIPAGWLTADGDTATLAAMVIVTPGATFDVTGVATLRLVGGADPKDAANLYSGSGHIKMSGVTVTSVDPTTNAPVDPKMAGRPVIDVASSGRFDATDVTLSNLGTPQIGEADPQAAVTFGKKSTGTLTRTTLTANSIGLDLKRSQGVALQDVTVSGSTGDGIVLFADNGTTLGAVKVDHNGGNGVSVSGTGDGHPVTGITSSANGGYGLSLTGQANADIGGITLSGDQSGGMELNSVTGARVHDIVMTAEPVGVYMHVNCKDLTLDKLSLTGGRTSLAVEKSTSGLHVTGTTIDSPQVAGISIGGKQTTVDTTTIHNARTALRVERGAVDVSVTGLALTGGQDGVVTSGGTTGVVVKDLSSDGLVGDSIRNLGIGMQVTGGRINGGNVGLNLQAATTVTGTQVGVTTTGVRVRTAGVVTLADVTVNAVSLGVDVADGSHVSLRNSVVHAIQSIRGTITTIGNNDLSLPPLNLLGAIGVPLLFLAVGLEVAHLARSRKVGAPRRRPLPPAVPVGAR